MEKLSKNNQSLVVAFERGYRMDKQGNLINPKQKIVKGFIDSGYRRTNIRYDGGSYKLLFHKFQAYQQSKEKVFEKGIVVRHLNGDSLDNSDANIKIGTILENHMDMTPEQRSERSKRTHSNWDHDMVMADRAAGLSYGKIMKKYGIKSQGTIAYIVKKYKNK